MGLVDLFRPKHRHSNARVRAEAVRAMTAEDGALLVQVARGDRDPDVRRLAIERLATPALLADVYEHESDRSLRDLAGERAAALWVDIACDPDDERASEAFAGIQRLGDQRALVDIAARGNAAVRRRALAEIREPRALAELARRAQQPETRLEAVARLDDVQVLRALATDVSDRDVGLAAIEKIDDPEVLETIAQKAKHKAVRLRARKVVAEMAAADKARRAAEAPAKSGATDEQKRRRAEKAQLLRDVEAVALDVAGGADKVRAAEAAFAALAAGDDIDGKFATAVRKFWQRREAFERQAAQAAASFEDAAARRREADARRAAQEAEQAARADQGAPAPAEDEAERAAKRAEAEARRAEVEARRAQQEADKAARAEARAAEAAELVTGFSAGLTQLEAMGAPDALAQTPLKKLDRVLANAADDADRLARLAPAGHAELLARYEALRVPLVRRAEELREAEEWQRYANVPRAEQLVRAAEELATTEVEDVGGVLKMLQGMWKDLGPLPAKQSKELWAKFKAFGDQAYEKVKAQRAVNAEKFAEIAAGKERLIAAAEALATSTDWDATAAQLKALQAEWKLSGALPRKQADELWNRFRAACDAFFQRRAPQLEARAAEQADNLQRKNALAARLETLAAEAKAGAPSGGWGKAIAEARDLQRQWRDLGFVPRRDADAAYARLRAAGDAFFAALDASRDAEAEARRSAGSRDRTELATLLTLDASADGAAAVTRALDVRERLRDQAADAALPADLEAQLGAALRHVATTFPDAARGTALDLAAAEAGLGKLIARVEALAPKADAPSAAAGSAEALADRLKQAMASNAFGGLRFAGRDPVVTIDELRAEWRDLALLVPAAASSREASFRAACERVLGEAEAADAAPAAPPAPVVIAAAAVVAPVIAPVIAPVVADPLPPPPAPVVEAAPSPRPATQPPLDALDTAWDLDDEVAATPPPALAAAEPAAAGKDAPPSASEMAGDGATEGDGLDAGWD